MTDPVAELRTLLHRAVDLACDILQQQPPAPPQGRTAEGAAPTSSSPPPPPSIRAAGPRVVRRCDRLYFERRERRWKAVPAGVTWEAWLASPEGVAWLGATGSATPRATEAQRGATPSATGRNGECNAPPHTPPSGEIPGDSRKKEEEARAHEGEAQQAQRNAQRGGATGATQQAQQGVQRPLVAATGLEILSQASKGRVSVLASGKDQLALMVALGDVGLRGLADLEAFGRALAGDGASKLWPRSAAACGKAALTPGFFLGRDGNARMLADGVTRWREQQARDASLAPRGDAPPTVAPPEPVLTEAEKGRRMREAFARADAARLAQQGGGVAHA